ncbi:hypothetical protein FXE11_06120 [Aggregatibacter actinomycetemcomitans]|uniref:hypothetical protein n=1 Tax=Aggregatibacter actinomycetemcomitans TaxID=714 RepID=UPI0011D671B3|nr:hypothetical protein [Aggregatibacter actinomycetemcomitans]TYA50851.1 hypothetical protein FXB81_07305 [Aggregatibacter actinomycetemcomitans]TYB01193.1 hypothetical protein FXE11_06120 [Aggregatibacter actinomycetemcomitans]
MSKLTKGTLSKSGLSMGNIEKTAMPQLKEEVTIAEQRTTIMIPVDVYKAAKKYALLNDIKLKEYFNDLLSKDLKEKGML